MQGWEAGNRVTLVSILLWGTGAVALLLGGQVGRVVRHELSPRKLPLSLAGSAMAHALLCPAIEPQLKMRRLVYARASFTNASCQLALKRRGHWEAYTAPYIRYRTGL